MPRYEYIKEALPILSMKIVGGWVHDQETLSDCIWGICHNMHESIHEMLFATNFHKKIPELLSTK